MDLDSSLTNQPISLEILFVSDVPVPSACAILVCLFMLQHYGTHKIGFMFAPIITIWLLFISGVGIYNIFYWNKEIIYAIFPVYMYRFVRNINIESWRSLGSIILCVAGQFLSYVLIVLIYYIGYELCAGFFLSPIVLVTSQDSVLLQDQRPCLQI